MVKDTYKYLHLTHFKDIPNWSVQYADEEDLGFTKKYPMARIGSFLVKSKDIIEVQDDVAYKQVTLKINNGGVVPRQKDGKPVVLKGAMIGTKRQHVVHAGQFIMSKIDARNGAYGIVPAELEGAIVTNDFPVFDVDTNKIIPQFLVLVSTTDKFIEFARKCSSGTTNRKRIDIDAFLQQQIPLPSIEEQKKILQEYNQEHNLYLESLKELDKTKSEIEDYIISKLSINKKTVENRNDSFLSFPHLSQLLTWSVEKSRSYIDGLLISSKYDNKALGEIVAINPQTDIKGLNDDDMISFIPMQSISEEFATWIGNDQCSKKNSTGYTKFMEGDLLWAKITPCMQNGKSAIVHNLKNGFGCGSTEFYILRQINSSVDLNYIHCILRLKLVLQDAMKYFTGSAGQQRVPVSYLENLVLPVPPIEAQIDIVNHIRELYIHLGKVKLEGLQLVENAKLKFENFIFD